MADHGRTWFALQIPTSSPRGPPARKYRNRTNRQTCFFQSHGNVYYTLDGEHVCSMLDA
jgi:hypothetical protein